MMSRNIVPTSLGNSDGQGNASDNLHSSAYEREQVIWEKNMHAHWGLVAEPLSRSHSNSKPETVLRAIFMVHKHFAPVGA